MALFKSGNPALSDKIFTNAPRIDERTETMTISGTVNKIGLLLLIVIASSTITWRLFLTSTNPQIVNIYIIVGIIVGFILAIAIVRKQHRARTLAPIYAFFEGLALGGILVFVESSFPGIVQQALVLTFGILFSLLAIYKTGIIKVTENFKLIVAAATGGIAIYYLISFIFSFFGGGLPLIHQSSTAGIIFSLLVIGIASANLVVDFDFIEKGAENGAPKYMEWYGAFGLIVTLIWLYIEILRLLSKLRSR